MPVPLEAERMALGILTKTGTAAIAGSPQQAQVAALVAAAAGTTPEAAAHWRWVRRVGRRTDCRRPPDLLRVHLSAKSRLLRDQNVTAVV